MNTYIIPANSKRSQLIFSMFRGVDLIIFLIGASISLLLLILEYHILEKISSKKCDLYIN